MACDRELCENVFGAFGVEFSIHSQTADALAIASQ